MRYSVSKEVLEGVLSYLSGRPWSEANQFIVRLQQDAKLLQDGEQQGSGAESQSSPSVVSKEQAAS